MDLRAPLQLSSMIKSMTDVVLPAIDPENQMAQEQAQLVVAMMHLMATRLPMQFHYDVDELKRSLGLSYQLIGAAAGGSLTTSELQKLAACVTDGESALAGAQTAPAELEAAALELRVRISALVETLWRDGEPSCRQAASRAVLAASKEQIERERAWFAPQGWDADPTAYPPIEDLIDFPRPSNESNA
ncbi:MAG: hypothetical protein ACI9BW_003423 [Gammaproteobacteria bacterium]|jgi:hypothetical protein